MFLKNLDIFHGEIYWKCMEITCRWTCDEHMFLHVIVCVVLLGLGFAGFHTDSSGLPGFLWAKMC